MTAWPSPLTAASPEAPGLLAPLWSTAGHRSVTLPVTLAETLAVTLAVTLPVTLAVTLKRNARLGHYEFGLVVKKAVSLQ